MTFSEDIDTIKKQVAAITWWHKIDLGNGIITPGKDNTPAKLENIEMASNLTGKSGTRYRCMGRVLFL